MPSDRRAKFSRDADPRLRPVLDSCIDSPADFGLTKSVRFENSPNRVLKRTFSDRFSDACWHRSDASEGSAP